MNVSEMTIEQLESTKINSVEQGKQLAADILEEQRCIHRQMLGLYDNEKWQSLSDRHYDLRRIRREVLYLTGKMAIERKRTHKR